jgi:hypothetical protein
VFTKAVERMAEERTVKKVFKIHQKEKGLWRLKKNS